MNLTKKIMLIAVFLFCVASAAAQISAPYDHANNPYGFTRIFHLDDDCTDEYEGADCHMHNGTYNATTPWGTGKSVDMNEVASNYIDSNYKDVKYSGDICISFWFHPTDALSGIEMLMGQKTGNSDSFQFYTNPANFEIVYIMREDATSQTFTTSGCSVSGGGWRNIVLSKEGTGLDSTFVYMNGTECTKAGVDNQDMGASNFTYDVYFNGWNDGETSALPAAGLFDDILMKNEPCSAGEVLTIYLGNYTVPAPNVTADLLFSNESGYYDNFTEDHLFNVSANVTLDGVTPMPNMTCNVTLEAKGMYEMTYNTSSLLYHANASFNYTVDDTYNISLECRNLTDPDIVFTDYSELLIINDLPLNITYVHINDTYNVTPHTEHILIEYLYGLWSFNFTVLDDHAVSNVSATLYDNASNFLAGDSDNTLFDFFVNSTVFSSSSLTYSLYVWSNVSTGADGNATFIFNVTDTVNPTCSGFINTSVPLNTNYTWNGVCVDESADYFNITCDNFTYQETGMMEDGYTFSGSGNVTQNASCNWTMCDNWSNCVSGIHLLEALVVIPPPPTNETNMAVLETGVCPENQSSVLMLGILIFFAAVLLWFGLTKSAVFGVFGCILLLVLSWIVVGCNSVIGYTVAGCALVGLIVMVFREM